MLTKASVIRNRYELSDVFLRCRFSVLYNALDTVSGMPLIIRKLNDSLPAGPGLRRDVRLQILREGHALSRLEHRNLPRVLDVIEEGDDIFLLMEDLKGRTMEVYCRDLEGLPDEGIVSRWMGQMLSVLEYLHSLTPPVIHRDIHPGSLLVSPHGVIKVAEFGLARIREEGKDNSEMTLFRAEGDPLFAAPEQLLRSPSSPANDIYSLGAVLYFLATGTKPRPSIERLQSTSGDRGVSALNPRISQGLESLIHKMMSPQLEKRFADVWQVKEELLRAFPCNLGTSMSLPSGFFAPGQAGTNPIAPGPTRAGGAVPAASGADKPSVWEDIFSLKGIFGKEKEVRAAPVSASPSKTDLEKFPFIDLSGIQLDRETGRIIPEGISRSIGGVCIGRRSAKQVTVAVVDPTQVHIYDHISYSTRGAYHPVLMRAEALQVGLAREFIYKGTGPGKPKSWLEWLEQKRFEADRLDVKASGDEPEIFREDVKGPVIEAADRIIKEAISINASDVHMETYENEMLVRYRIDGILHQVSSYSPRMGDAIIKRLKLTAGMDIAQERITQGGRISVKVRDREYDLRVSIVPVPCGENVVMRLLDKGAFNYKLSDLGFEEETGNRYRRLLGAPHGMILVSGPTGSGKSTTLYASLLEIMRPDRKLLTVEDPIEYQMPGITQVQVNLAPRDEEKKVTFARALREFLRQDPDVILVGEIRDHETAAIGVQAALTGHLLLSTIHTNDSVGIITRLEDMGVEPYLISSTLVGGIAQRLVRRVCPGCGEKVEPSPDLLERFRKEGISRYGVFQGKGCIQCHHTGSKGRLAIYEILEVTPELRPLIASRAGAEVISGLAVSQGMRTLYQDGLLKVAGGRIPYGEVLRVTLSG